MCQRLFCFYSATEQAESFKDIFCSAVSEGSTQDGKEKSMFQGCVTGVFSCVDCFIMRMELKIPPRQYLKYQSHCLMPLSHCTTNSIAQRSAVSRYVKHR